VAAGSTTETYAALRLDIDSWRWAGVPFFIRKCLPATQTEARLIFRRPPRLGFLPHGVRAPEAGQTVISSIPRPASASPSTPAAATCPSPRA
jgi:glucose-6-phosphate 1-dehydrogenase